MKILIINHPQHKPAEDPYLLTHLCKAWSDMGHSIAQVNGINGPLPAADTVIMHVNLTVVPPEYAAAIKHYPLVINLKASDISKSVFSKFMVNKDDDYAGPVMIKTRKNCGGIPERMLKIRAGEMQPDAAPSFGWENIQYMREYPILKSLKDVPPGVWQNKNLIVEKFLPERDVNGKFCVREWIFLGDQEIHFINMSSSPIVKGPNTEKRDYLPENIVPNELRTLRNKLGIDYGKFDYGIHKGTVILYDINKTPSAPSDLSGRPGAFDRVRRLGMGLEFYMNRKTA